MVRAVNLLFCKLLKKNHRRSNYYKITWNLEINDSLFKSRTVNLRWKNCHLRLYIDGDPKRLSHLHVRNQHELILKSTQQTKMIIDCVQSFGLYIIVYWNLQWIMCVFHAYVLLRHQANTQRRRCAQRLRKGNRPQERAGLGEAWQNWSFKANSSTHESSPMFTYDWNSGKWKIASTK